MSKALRITCILAAFITAVLIVLPVLSGGADEQRRKEILEAPSAIDNFRKNKTDRDANRKKQISPLVEQARAFALYLNPPKPVTKTRKKRSKRIRETGKPKEAPRPSTVSTNFKLIGTSYYASHPELSLALIEVPGKGLRWKRQSEKVGHLIIEEVKDGMIIVKDGEKRNELYVERKAKRSLLKGSSSEKTSSSIPSNATSSISVETNDTTLPPGIDWQAVEEAQSQRREMLSKIQAHEETESQWQEVLAEIEAMRVSTEEAKNISDLGRNLEKDKISQKDPNKAPTTKLKKSRTTRRSRMPKRARPRPKRPRKSREE